MHVVDGYGAAEQNTFVEAERLDEHEIDQFVVQRADPVVRVDGPGAHDGVGDDFHLDLASSSSFGRPREPAVVVGLCVLAEDAEDLPDIGGAALVDQMPEAEDVDEGDDALFVVGIIFVELSHEAVPQVLFLGVGRWAVSWVRWAVFGVAARPRRLFANRKDPSASPFWPASGLRCRAARSGANPARCGTPRSWLSWALRRNQQKRLKRQCATNEEQRAYGGGGNGDWK